jgi:hypothetical protein
MGTEFLGDYGVGTLPKKTVEMLEIIIRKLLVTPLILLPTCKELLGGGIKILVVI